MTLIIVIQLLLHLFLAAKACTEIRVTTQDKSTKVIGPTPHSGTPRVFFTWSIYPLTAPILIMLMHHFKTGQIHRHHLNAYGRDVASEGMNSEGLTVGVLYLPGFTKYQVHI